MAIDIQMSRLDVNMTSQIEMAKQRALESCGNVAEGYAKMACPVKSGNLRNHISHKISGDTCYIGTDVEYAPYVELGTGVYCTMGGGRKGWWVYVPGSTSGKKSGKTYTKQQAVIIMNSLRKKGLDAQITQGSKPHPFLKPAVSDHNVQYRHIIESELRNG